MNILLKLANRPSERVLKQMAPVVASVFLTLIAACFATQNLLKEQQAANDAHTLTLIAQASAPDLLPPPAFKGGR